MAGSAPMAKRDVHLKRTFQAFANRGYVRLWFANFLLYTSRWMQMTLLAWLILDLTDSPFLVALVGFFSRKVPKWTPAVTRKLYAEVKLNYQARTLLVSNFPFSYSFPRSA